MKNRIPLGWTKQELYGEAVPIYLHNFTWDCGWYWGGGYVGNKDTHFHFDGAFLEVPDARGHPLGRIYSPWQGKTKADGFIVPNGCMVWADILDVLGRVPERIVDNWWRIKDLFKQFYRHRDSAECFQYGGHCTTTGRTDAEINRDMAMRINLHILTAIIPEVHRVCGFYDDKPAEEHAEFFRVHEQLIINKK